MEGNIYQRNLLNKITMQNGKKISPICRSLFNASYNQFLEDNVVFQFSSFWILSGLEIIFTLLFFRFKFLSTFINSLKSRLKYSKTIFKHMKLNYLFQSQLHNF